MRVFIYGRFSGTKGYVGPGTLIIFEETREAADAKAMAVFDEHHRICPDDGYEGLDSVDVDDYYSVRQGLCLCASSYYGVQIHRRG